MPDEYAAFASVYDAIYEAMKDYRVEADRLHVLIQSHKRTQGSSLLDVACGTGLHDQYLRDRYQVEGLDVSEAMLAIARTRLPDVPFHHGDMSAFHLGRTFDAVTCLFSAVAHLGTVRRLNAAIECMARHVKAGGVLVVEPFISPDQWRDGTVGTNFVPEKRVARLTTSTREGDSAVLEMHHFVDWDEQSSTAKYFVTRHQMALYATQDYLDAFTAAGLAVTTDVEGLMGRGLFIGVKR